MNPEWIAGIAALVLSMALETIPGLKEWWASIEKQWKPLYLLLACVLVPVAVVLAACYGVNLGVAVECPNVRDPQLWVNTVTLGLAAFAVSQVGYVAVSNSLGKQMNGAGTQFATYQLKALPDIQLAELVVATVAEAQTRGLLQTKSAPPPSGAT